jgi:hypothetical protein
VNPSRSGVGPKGMVGAAVALVIIIALAVYSISPRPEYTSTSESTSSVSTSSVSTSASSESASTSTPNVQQVQSAAITTTTAGTSIEYSFDFNNCSGNCTVDIPWSSIYPQYQTLQSLITDTLAVPVLANVTSASTKSVNGTPVTLYEVTVTHNLLGTATPSVGTTLPVDQVGGTLNGATWSLSGYPTLDVGNTYVLFLGAPGGVVGGQYGDTVNSGPLVSYQSSVDHGEASITVGGPQGLFYVQGGNVYSLDNMYPQVDSWLPVKAAGVPLAQFIQEVQSAAGINTTAVATSTQTNYADTATGTYTGAVATTLTQTEIACSNSPGTSEIVCLYFLGWGFNYTASEAFIQLGNYGPGIVTIANVTFSGSSTNRGYTGSVTVDLTSLNLTSQGYLQQVNSPALPNLQMGDQLMITIRGTAGAYFVTTVTETAGPQA